MAPGTDLSRRERAPLNRERVLAEAVALADEAGMGSLTMRRLADRLHVEPMSLYYHVAGKDEILDGMVDLVFGEVGSPGGRGMEDGHARPGRLRARRAAPAPLGHRADGLAAERWPGNAPVPRCDHRLPAGAGFSIELAAHAISAIDSYLYGFAMQELSLPFNSPEETAEMAVTFLEQFPAQAFPTSPS